jgi:hypothetical protein
MFLGIRVRPVRKADNLTGIYKLNVYKLWDLQHVKTLWASTVCYTGSFTYAFHFDTFHIEFTMALTSRKLFLN